MTQEQYEQAKSLLSQIANLEKKASQKGEYNSIRIMVSNNNTSFVELASIIGSEAADEYKSNILSECNKYSSTIDGQIKELRAQFDKI